MRERKYHHREMASRGKKAPFEFDAIRPFVSLTLHEIQLAKRKGLTEESERIATELSGSFDSLLNSFDLDTKNRYFISTRAEDRGVIETTTKEELSLSGVWFKRITAPAWLDAKLGPQEVWDTSNHILFVAVRFPFLAVLGTYEKARVRLSSDLEQGFCGEKQLSFVAPVVDQTRLERAFVRGQTRVSWLAGLHSSVDTKPDSKVLTGHDLRKALDPFSDGSFTLTGAVSILPELKEKRRVRYTFSDRRTSEAYAKYAFRVGVAPEGRKVWTVPAKEFNHLLEEIRVVFDTLAVSSDEAKIGPWSFKQEGLMFLSKPIPSSALPEVQNAFDVSLDLPPPAEPGSEVQILSERQRCLELWRAYGQMDVIESSNSASFKAGVRFDNEPVLEIEIEPRKGAFEWIIDTHVRGRKELQRFSDGMTCFDTIFGEGSDTSLIVRYDSGHTIRGPRLYVLGWQDVFFESWKWLFRPASGGLEYYAQLEKPVGTGSTHKIPDRKLPKGWEEKLGTKVSRYGSLFEYVVVHAETLFKPEHAWHLCCDDGPGEVADFVYFEPAAGRLYLIHIKAASVREGDDQEKKAPSNKTKRDISVKAYEEVVSQATKNLRYLEASNLAALLEKGKDLPIAKACFYVKSDKPHGSRNLILSALKAQGTKRLPERKVIVFQPHVRKSVWEGALDKWEKGEKATPQNQVNRFLQLRTLLADAEITCRKIGAEFEVWGEDDSATTPSTGEGR